MTKSNKVILGTDTGFFMFGEAPKRVRGLGHHNIFYKMGTLFDLLT